MSSKSKSKKVAYRLSPDNPRNAFKFNYDGKVQSFTRDQFIELANKDMEVLNRFKSMFVPMPLA